MPPISIPRARACAKPFHALIGIALATSLLVGGCGGDQRASLPPVEASTTTQAPNAALDAYVQSELIRQNIPGLALIVQQNDHVVYAKGYGYADLGKSLPATTEQRFHIGSITKQFVAAAVMLLVENGKMALDDKISKYLGQVPPEWAPITVRHLLSHTSGLQQDADQVAGIDPARAYTTDELLTFAKAYKPRTEPGKVYSYSNLGYQIMGGIVEKASGVFYGDLLQQRIFNPLGMGTARVMEPKQADGNATGYELQNSKLVPLEMAGLSPAMTSKIRTGAGGIEMSASDLAKWDASLSTDKILKKSSRDQVWAANAVVEKTATYTISYGLGWFLSDYNGHPKVYHSGGMPGFTSDYLRYTNDKTTVIVLTNLGAGSDPEKMSRTIANMVVPGISPPL